MVDRSRFAHRGADRAGVAAATADPLETALRNRDYAEVRYDAGFWGKVVARINSSADGLSTTRSSIDQLLKEVRKSTKAIPDGAVILNGEFEVVNCNRAAQALVGLKLRQDKAACRQYIARSQIRGLSAADDRDKSVEVMSPVLDGHWLNCRLVPYRRRPESAAHSRRNRSDPPEQGTA